MFTLWYGLAKLKLKGVQMFPAGCVWKGFGQEMRMGQNVKMNIYRYIYIIYIATTFIIWFIYLDNFGYVADEDHIDLSDFLYEFDMDRQDFDQFGCRMMRLKDTPQVVASSRQGHSEKRSKGH